MYSLKENITGSPLQSLPDEFDDNLVDRKQSYRPRAGGERETAKDLCVSYISCECGRETCKCYWIMFNSWFSVLCFCSFRPIWKFENNVVNELELWKAWMSMLVDRSKKVKMWANYNVISLWKFANSVMVILFLNKTFAFLMIIGNDCVRIWPV